MSNEMIEQTIRRLEIDRAAEIEAINARYEERIAYFRRGLEMKAALEVKKSSAAKEPPSGSASSKSGNDKENSFDSVARNLVGQFGDAS